MGTYSVKHSEIERKWRHIDANGLVLGRLAVEIAKILRGKNKVNYTPHLDVGDYVVVTNAAKVVLTGRKAENKKYYRHSGYPGGIKETTPEKILAGKFPERILKNAVEKMIPRNPLGRKQLKKLRIYAGEEHKHEAQGLEKLDVGALNRKNKRN